jgi:hypothetical protein
MACPKMHDSIKRIQQKGAGQTPSVTFPFIHSARDAFSLMVVRLGRNADSWAVC